MLFHPFMSVPRNDYLDEDMPEDAVFPEEDSPACPLPSQPSRSPSFPGSPRPGPANQSYAPRFSNVVPMYTKHLNTSNYI